MSRNENNIKNWKFKVKSQSQITRLRSVYTTYNKWPELDKFTL